MRINHNLSALNTYSRLSAANFAQSKSLEKLSSGQRINRAGDDAAGLAISEKMRSQIRGLNQASRNAQDGISMIQTAEGALGETHSILQRMRELAVQASNDTNTSQDRGEIQKEINQLSSEINRIAGTTEFNKQTLLDGGQAAGSVKGISVGITGAGTDCTQAVYVYEFSCAVTASTTACTICIKGVDILGGCILQCSTIVGSVKELAGYINTHCSSWIAEAVGGKLTIKAVANCANTGAAGTCTSILSFGNTANCYDLAVTNGKDACSQVTQIAFTNDGIKDGVVISAGACSVGLWDSSKGTFYDSNDAKVKMGVDTLIDINCYDGSTICAKDLVTQLVSDASLTTSNTLCRVGDNVLKITTTATGSIAANETKISVKSFGGSGSGHGNGITLQIGANTDQNFTVSFEDMTGKGINVTSETSGAALTASNGKVAYFTNAVTVENNGTFNQYSLDVSDADKASAAVSALDDAIGLVSAERSKLGAYQNRLEHTISNLDTSSENLTAAESRIRDVDMAKEMMEFTKNNILNQAATAMLAQANQQPQGVLQLLR